MRQDQQKHTFTIYSEFFIFRQSFYENRIDFFYFAKGK